MTTGGVPSGDVGGGGAGGAGGGAGGAGAGAGDQVAPPWGADVNAEWKIGDKPWYEVVIPEGPARDLAVDKKYANPVKMGEAYYELNRTASHANADNTIIIPGENATPEDWNKVYTKLGRPADIEGYKDVKWGENADPKLVEFGKTLAFKLGLSPKAAESVMAAEWNKFAQQFATDANTEGAAENARTVETLKGEWGKDFDAHLAAGTRVLNALKANGISEQDLVNVEAHIGAAPVIKLLATIGKLTGEASFVQGSTLGNMASDPAAMTPEQAAAEIARLNGDKDFQKTYTDRMDPNHKAATEKMLALYAKAGDKIQL